jgi:CHAT domain-containing protein
MSLNNLAKLYYSLGEYAKAEPLLVQALDIEKRVLGETNPDYAMSLNNLAMLYQSLGEYAKAEPLNRQTMEFRTKMIQGLLPTLSEARAVSLSLAGGFGPGPWLSAVRHLPEAQQPEVYPLVWQGRGLVMRMMVQRRLATLGSKEAEPVWRELQDTSQRLAQLTLYVAPPQQAEARRRRLAELNEAKEQLEARLASLSSEYRRSVEVRQAQPAYLAKLLPRGTAVVEILQVPVWSQPEKPGMMKPEMHYEAFVLRRESAAAGAKVPWIHLGPAKAIDEAAAQWRGNLLGGRSSEEPEPAPEAVLREKILVPIESHLDGCTQVILIPDGGLNFLAWSALPGRKPGTILLEDYALAVADGGHQLYEALTEPERTSSGILLVGGVDYDASPAQKPLSQEMLASAEQQTRAPAMKDQIHWSFLPGTRAEVQGIAQAYKRSPRPTLLAAAEASEASLRATMPRSRYIHLATHGFFADESFRSILQHDPQGENLFGRTKDMGAAQRATVTARNPLILSGVVLAGANRSPKTDRLGLPTGEDGILTAEEITALDLRGTELVVLSACDTGLGNVAGGEGVMGMARAFHLAGVRNVIASLWKVDDQATAALMKIFYHNLWEKTLPPIEALRQAQLAIYRHPEQIGPVARSRGLDLDKLLPVADSPGRQAPSATAPAKQWAAFVLSGPGN